MLYWHITLFIWMEKFRIFEEKTILKFKQLFLLRPFQKYGKSILLFLFDTSALWIFLSCISFLNLKLWVKELSTNTILIFTWGILQNPLSVNIYITSLCKMWENRPWSLDYSWLGRHYINCAGLKEQNFVPCLHK